ncbi:T9SS type A sorting domain-containing protein, partial [Bacteroidota bacterium]
TFIKNEGVNFSIKMYEAENMELDVWLLDKKLNTEQNLSQKPVYLFTAFDQDDPNRFLIHFSPVGIEDQLSLQSNIQIWSSKKTIHILNPDQKIGSIRIVNIYGQELLKTQLNRDTKQEIHLNVPAGCYLVNVRTEEGVLCAKVLIE